MKHSLLSLAVLFLLFTSILLSGCSREIPANFDYGNWSDSTYRNDFFGFSITMPESWHIASKEEMDAIEWIDEDFVNRQEAEKAAKIAEITTADLFNVFRYTDDEAEARESFNPSVSAFAETLPLLINRAEYVKQTRQLIAKTMPGINIKSETNRTVNGVEFIVLETEVSIQGIRIHQEYWVCLKHGFALLFLLTWVDAEEKQMLDDIKATLKWD